ncbi:hypothetical protein S83_021066 [Arachis hypogaea]
MSPNTYTPIIIVFIFVHLYCLTLLTSSQYDSIECIPSEREALLRFKHHLIEPLNRLSSWNVSNPNCCQWDYVVCSNVTSHVFQLHLNTSRDAFYYHGYLNSVAFGRSMFSGEINDSVVELKHLNYLNLSGNDFGGHLTNQLEMFKNLESLSLFNNLITGEIPQSLAKLQSLRYMTLTKNQLSGNPFKTLGLFPKLLSLSIDDNLFQGIVQEDDLVNFTALRVLQVSGNNFTLKVHPSWQQKFQLIVLRMNSWKLGPSFPSWIQ